MRNSIVLDLAECTEFRQTLLARPPRIVHGTAGLLIPLLGAALAWAAATQANLVVRAPGRVRPVATPVKILPAARGELLSAGVGGQVAEVNFREGDEVRRGALLIRLETGRLDNEIAKQRLLLRVAEAELARLDQLAGLSVRHFEAARSKAEAELAQAREDVRRAKAQQGPEIQLAELELEAAREDAGQLGALLGRRAAAPAELTKAKRKAQEAREKRDKARLPVDRAGCRWRSGRWSWSTGITT